MIALSALATLISGPALAQSQWIEVRPADGFAYAVDVSRIDPTTAIRPSIVAFTHDTAPNPGGQYFSVMRGEVDCVQRVSRLSEIALYSEGNDGTATVLPIEPEPRPIADGSIDALICEWPNRPSIDQRAFAYASEFADAVRARRDD